ncbi:hypothetical protein D046_2751A, partial [Vibrio parahaemolyticus V-223/04]
MPFSAQYERVRRTHS